jgi:hypothetical protein
VFLVLPQGDKTTMLKKLKPAFTFFCLSIAMMLLLSIVSCPVDSGKITSSDETVNMAAITGVPVPAIGETPVSAITETTQYTGTVTWDGDWSWSPYFGGNKAYTATITLTAKSGYTFAGVSEDFFTVSGSSVSQNSPDSGVVTAVFPVTTSVSVGDSTLGGYVAYILQPGDSGYIAGEQRGLIAAAANQSDSISWAEAAFQSTSVPGDTSTDLGTGAANTDNIIAQNGAGNTYAAGLARSYTDGTYTDWFLPSWDEINTLYDNAASIGGLSGTLIWTSSEGNATNASALNPGNGNNHNDPKSSTWSVRAVRYF